MNPPPETPATRPSVFTAEAMVGLGITIGAFGLLFLLLGWAQQMRQVKDSSLILLGIGAVLFVVGAITALSARSRRRG